MCFSFSFLIKKKVPRGSCDLKNVTCLLIKKNTTISSLYNKQSNAFLVSHTNYANNKREYMFHTM